MLTDKIFLSYLPFLLTVGVQHLAMSKTFCLSTKKVKVRSMKMTLNIKINV